MPRRKVYAPDSGVSGTGIPVFEKVPSTQFGKRSAVFRGKRIRYINMDWALLGSYHKMLLGYQNTLALAQYLCNKAHERAMGKDTEIGPVFDWMEQFLTIAAAKGFPEMPVAVHDAMMWGMLGQKEREAFSREGLWNIISLLDTVPSIVLTTFSPEWAYDEVFVNNPDPDFKWRVLTRAHGNVWVLKYPARYMAIQWMMAVVRYELAEIGRQMEEVPTPPTTFFRPGALKPVQNQLKLIREAYSMVEACYAEWVEFLRNSGLLGKYYSPEIEGIVEAPQERRPPPLLEH